VAVKDFAVYPRRLRVTRRSVQEQGSKKESCNVMHSGHDVVGTGEFTAISWRLLLIHRLIGKDQTAFS
jgi:hypothetical protein